MKHQKLIVKNQFSIWQPDKATNAQKVSFSGINFVIDNGSSITINLKDKVIKENPYSSRKTVVKQPSLEIEKKQRILSSNQKID